MSLLMVIIITWQENLLIAQVQSKQFIMAGSKSTEQTGRLQTFHGSPSQVLSIPYNTLVDYPFEKFLYCVDKTKL